MDTIKKILFATFLLLGLSGSAQIVQPYRYVDNSFTGKVNVGVGTVRETAASAYFEIGPSSNGLKGFLPPRTTTTLRDAISSPANGLLLYNVTTSRYSFYNGSTWLDLGPTIDTAGMLANYINNIGYALLRTGQTVRVDSATLALTFLRRKDSLTSTNLLGYVTKKILADTAAAIRADFPVGGSGAVGEIDSSFALSGDTLQAKWWINVKDYQAKGDGVRVTDANITNGDATLTSASSSFTSANIGQSIVVYGGAAAGGELRTTIASINSATSVELAANAGATVSGGVAKYGTNNTVPFQTALNLADAEGKKVFVPIGRYFIFDTLRTTSIAGNPNSQLYIPLNSYTFSSSVKTIELIGEISPNIFSDPINNKDNPTTGVVIESVRRVSGAIIGASSESAAWGDFNFVQFSIKNIHFRVDTDSAGVIVGAKTTGIDASKLSMFDCDNVRIDIINGFTSVQPEPTAYGIKTPALNNFVRSNITKSFIEGFYTAITVNEHTVIDDVFIDVCYNGLQYLAAHHTSHIDRICIARSKYIIVVSGIAKFSIDDLSVEYKTDNATPTGAWFNTTTVLKEDVPSGLGSIKYTIIESGIGLNNALFNRTNATSSLIEAKTINRTGPVWTTATRPSVDYGVIGYNTDLGCIEFYDPASAAWQTAGSNRGLGSISYNQGTGSGASTELAYDATNNFLLVKTTTSQDGIQIGEYPGFPTYSGLWAGNITRNGNNYAFIGDGTSETIFNGATLKFRIANGSSPNAIAVDASGNVGIAQNSPTTKLQVAGRFASQQGADVASAAGAIALGSDGNSFEITGTSAITLISNVGWVNGAEVTLIFTSTATLTDGTANSGTDIGMELAGNANFVATADDVVTLVLCEVGGTQRWREKSRSVN